MKYTRSLLAIAVLATISIPASAASLNYQLDGVDKAVSIDTDFMIGDTNSSISIDRGTGHGVNLINDNAPITGTILGKTINLSTKSGRATQIAFGNALTLGDASTETVTLYAAGTDSPAGIFAMSSQKTVDTHEYDTTVDVRAKAISVTVVNSSQAPRTSTASAVSASAGSAISLGDETTENIILVGRNDSKASEVINGVTYSSSVITLWADGKNENSYHAPAGKVSLTSKNIVISAEGYNDVRAIHSGSNTMTPLEKASVEINADRVVITSKSLDESHSCGISAMSTGVVKIVGDTTITADDAIVARGDATVAINVDGKHYTQITGNVDFNYDKATSGTGVDAGVTINLVGANSYWVGSPMYSYGSGQAPADKTTITGLYVALSDGAQWTPTLIEDTTDNTVAGHVGVALNTLNMNDGIINVNEGAAQKVMIDRVQGSGGTINVKASTADGKTFESGSVQIGTVEQTVPQQPKLTVKYSGINADHVKDQQAAMDALNQTVKVTDQGTQVDKTNVIEEGAVKGQITQQVDADGTKGEIFNAQNTKLDAYGSLSSLAALQWRHEMNDLTKRMGELRMSQDGVGGWARLYGSEHEYGKQNLTAKNTSIQVGSDVDVGNGWKVGAAFSYTDGSSTYEKGDADSKAYGFGVYGTWFATDGQFVDLIAKYSRMDTDFALDDMKGDSKNNAFSVTAEYGWHLKLGQVAFVEPQAELTYGRVFGDTFTTTNDAKVEQDDFESLIARAGVRTGFYFPKDKGTIYMRASVLHDFKGESSAVASLVSDSTVRSDIYDDLGGTWYELGLGANFNLTDTTYTYVDLEKTFAGTVKENWRWNVGVRHVF